jgi:hypothetical protein
MRQVENLRLGKPMRFEPLDDFGIHSFRMLGQIDRVAEDGPFTLGCAGGSGILENQLDDIRAFRQLAEALRVHRRAIHAAIDARDRGASQFPLRAR